MQQFMLNLFKFELIFVKAFSGNFTHTANIDERLKFLEFILVESENEVKVGEEGITELWKIFMENNSFTFESVQFLKWLSKSQEENRKMSGSGSGHYQYQQPYPSTNHFLTFDEQVFFFKRVLTSNKNYANKNGVELSFFKSFAKYFKIINEHHKLVQVRRGRVRVLQFNNLFGTSLLWDLVSTCANDKCREYYAVLLVDLHLNLGKSLLPERKTIWQLFFKTSFQLLQEAEAKNSEHVIQAIVELISLFLDRFDGTRFEMDDDLPFQHTFPINIILKPENVSRKIEISFFNTVGNFRLAIANAFNIHISQFQLLTKHAKFQPEDDDTAMKEFGTGLK
jgi:hypothetical protein